MKIPSDKIAGPWVTDYEIEVVTQMMKDGWHNYKYVEQFEEEFADYIGRKYCLMTPCGTHAIHLSLAALGIGPGDEVIVPELTWTGSIAPVVYCGANPVMCDCDSRWGLSTRSIAEQWSEKTKAIISVGLYGNMPDYKSIYADHNPVLIEDACEGLGSKYGERKAGTFGIASCFSFHRTKTITTGEGGAMLTDDDELYQKAKILRDLGRDPDDMYKILVPSFKYMPSNLMGALALGQLHRIEELVGRKRDILHRYMKNLEGQPLTINQDDDIVYNGAWATAIVFDEIKFKDIQPKLEALGIPTRPFFYPLSSQPAYSRYAPVIKNKNAYSIAERGLVLPSAYHVTDDEQDYICEQIIGLL